MRRKVNVKDLPQHHIAPVRQAQRALFLDLRQIQPVEHGLHPANAEGLAQIIAGVYLVALAGKFVAGGAENDLHLRIGFPDFPGNIHSRPPGHENIQKDQVKSARPPGR